jgi:hypothetical protein
VNKLPSRLRLQKTEAEFKGIWVFPTKELFIITVEFKEGKWGAEILPVLGLNAIAAVGSGGAYALGAMLAGKSAEDAVKIACKLDNNSGLPIESLRFE